MRPLGNIETKNSATTDVTRRAEVPRLSLTGRLPHRKEAKGNDEIYVGDACASGHGEAHIDDTLCGENAEAAVGCPFSG